MPQARISCSSSLAAPKPCEAGLVARNFLAKADPQSAFSFIMHLSPINLWQDDHVAP
jgi:hypothetical protein